MSEGLPLSPEELGISEAKSGVREQATDDEPKHSPSLEESLRKKYGPEVSWSSEEGLAAVRKGKEWFFINKEGVAVSGRKR